MLHFQHNHYVQRICMCDTCDCSPSALSPFVLLCFLCKIGPAQGFFLFKRNFSCQCWLFGARAWVSVKHQMLYDKSYIYLNWLFIPLSINNGEWEFASFKKVHYHILKEPWNVLLIHQRTKTDQTDLSLCLRIDLREEMGQLAQSYLLSLSFYCQSCPTLTWAVFVFICGDWGPVAVLLFGSY